MFLLFVLKLYSIVCNNSRVIGHMYLSLLYYVITSRMRCRMFCEHGFEKDEQGCDMCRCRTEDTPAVRRPVCPEVMCMMFCEHGFEKDEHGCDMCRCLPVCPEMMCTMYCASGFEKNEQGCNICKCKTDNICHVSITY